VMNLNKNLRGINYLSSNKGAGGKGLSIYCIGAQKKVQATQESFV